MGKGDKRTKKGKRRLKSFGVSRPRTAKSARTSTVRKTTAKKKKTSKPTKRAAKPTAKTTKPSLKAKTTPIAKKASTPKTKKAATVTKKAAPAKKAAATTTKADNLTKIEGIGPKLSQILSQGGIGTFDALSKSSTDQLKEILAGAGNRYKAFDPTTWPEQAKLAADGKWDDLQKLQDSLQGGKKK